jgi:transposase
MWFVPLSGMRKGISIEITPADRGRLQSIVRDRNSPQKHVWRARIVLLSGDGLGTMAIMRAVGKGKTVVWRWQERFMQEGVAGLTRDKTRPARIAPLPAETADRVVALTNQAPPHQATHWTASAMAKVIGISPSSVRRIWTRHRLQPHRVRLFKLSNDPQFAAKLKEVVGLYIDPPAHAVVLSIDEKSQIQALDRTQPGLPMKKGRCATMTHDYKRNSLPRRRPGAPPPCSPPSTSLRARSSDAACSAIAIRNSSAFSTPSSAKSRSTRRSMSSSTIMPPTSTPR